MHEITARPSDETARSTTAQNELNAHGQELTQVRAARDSLAQRAQELAAKMDEMQRWIDQVRSLPTFRLLRSMDRLHGRPRA